MKVKIRKSIYGQTYVAKVFNSKEEAEQAIDNIDIIGLTAIKCERIYGDPADGWMIKTPLGYPAILTLSDYELYAR